MASSVRALPLNIRKAMERANWRKLCVCVGVVAVVYKTDLRRVSIDVVYLKVFVCFHSSPIQYLRTI